MGIPLLNKLAYIIFSDEPFKNKDSKTDMVFIEKIKDSY